MVNFYCVKNQLFLVSKYNYLGLVLNEYLDYGIVAKAVAMSASPALGILIAKFKLNGGLHFNTFTTLYDSLVWSI